MTCRRGVFAQLAERLDAVLAGHREIEGDQVGAGADGLLQGLVAVGRLEGRSSLVRKQGGQEDPDLLVVVDNQNPAAVQLAERHVTQEFAFVHVAVSHSPL